MKIRKIRVIENCLDLVNDFVVQIQTFPFFRPLRMFNVHLSVIKELERNSHEFTYKQATTTKTYINYSLKCLPDIMER